MCHGGLLLQIGSHPHLAEVCKKLDIPEGQPFILDEDHKPFTEVCQELDITPESFIRFLKDVDGPEAIVGSSFVTEVNRFLKVRASTSRSFNTWKADAEQLCILLRWVKAQGKSWQQITLDDLHTFYQARRLKPSPHTKRQISPKTWNACISTASRLYQWAAEKRLIDKAPFTYRQVRSRTMGMVEKNTLTAAIPVEPIRYLTLEEYRIFIKALRKSRNGERDKAFANLLVKTGLRVREACAFRIDLLPDPEAERYAGRKTIPYTLTGKGNKERRILIPKSCLKEIDC